MREIRAVVDPFLEWVEQFSTSPIFQLRDDPTGETLFTTEPRSFVICGSLAAFQAEHGINERKFRSFELDRRKLIRPEIITFDELYERARFIVEAEHENDDGTA